MSSHAITSSVVLCALFLFSVVFIVQPAVAVQGNDTLPREHPSALGKEAQEAARLGESSKRGAMPCCPERFSSHSETIHEQDTFAVSTNTPQEHHTAPSKRETRTPIEKEGAREEFALEPIHLLLLGSVLVALGMLRNRYKKV